MVYKLFILFLLIDGNVGKRILGFFPMPGKSQHNVFAPILYGLAKQGHSVVYVTPHKPDLSHPNLDVRLKPGYLDKFREKLDLKKLGEAPAFLVTRIMSNGLEELAEYVYGDAESQAIIHSNDTYDAVLLESYFLQEPVSALAHKFGCVAIEVSSLGDSAWINELAGLPDNPSYQVDWRAPLTDSMSFFERLYNSYVTLSAVLSSYYHLWRMQGLMDKYFNYTGWESRPPLSTLVSNRSIILVNRDLALDYPYPLASHVKDVGGVTILPKKPLPKDLQEFMDTANKGVIYFSLGSHLQTSELMKSETGKTFTKVFRELPQKILMKWESDEIIELPPNFKTYKWIPQQDVLAHKNCVLFITHGGLLSLTEAVYYGVPVIGIPHFGDQPKNVVQIQNAGNGIYLSKENITTTSVSWAIKEILTNPRYREEMTRRSEMLRDKRHSALDEAVYWVEYAMKYPNALTPKAAFLNFFQLHMIDIKLFWILAIFIIYKFMRMLVKLLHKIFVISVVRVFFRRNKEKLN